MLIRHAKSSWSDPEVQDIDRPLNRRGRLASTLMGTWLKDESIALDQVWLSPAMRSAETFAHMGVEPTLETQTHKALYMADPNTILNILRSTPAQAGTAAVIGHQPGLSSFARKLADGSQSQAEGRAFTKFPTGGVAIFDCDVEAWADVKFGQARFVTFVTPKDLV
ncbi:MAG: histidine phosphatase family protein [Pseudomonadota bacterium]